MPTELIWACLDHPGYEHVRVAEDHPEWTVFDSMVIREDEGNVRRGGYTLVVDKLWRTLELRLMVEETPEQMEALHLIASGDGTWTDVNGNRIAELDGCIDVDIQWSPLTNTLPIRRLHLRTGGEQEIRVAYVSLPDLSVQAVAQRYTAVNVHQIRYASLTSGFQGELTVDNEGFVVDYPDRFRRDWPAFPRQA